MPEYEPYGLNCVEHGRIGIQPQIIMASTHDYINSNRDAWDRAAGTYADEVAQDIAFLRDGGVSLLEPERRLLGDLSDVQMAIHLQCSHGRDALSLLNLGAASVVGIDISTAMLAQARQKSEALGAAARWMESEVLAVPHTLDGTADLVYTGQGALPWVSDLQAWAQVVMRLLRPGGRLLIYEGHPLSQLWDTEATTHRLKADGRGYFDVHPRANEDFPAAATARYTPEGEAVPTAWEWVWPLGAVVTAVAEVGLRIERLEEHPQPFWNQFPNMSPEALARLPHCYALLARKVEGR